MPDIPEATGLNYTPTSVEVGKRLRLRETATGPGGTAISYSNWTNPVNAAPAILVAAPYVNEMEPATAQSLIATAGVYQNEVSRMAMSWEYVEPAAEVLTAPAIHREPYEGIDLTADAGSYNYAVSIDLMSWEYIDA